MRRWYGLNGIFLLLEQEAGQPYTHYTVFLCLHDFGQRFRSDAIEAILGDGNPSVYE
jgi:hypothetical protein